MRSNPVLISNDAVRLEILPLGATLRRFEVRLSDGSWRNILLGHPQLSDYPHGLGYLGASVGRFANRIGDARFTLDGTSFHLAPNEGPNQLHGGPDGFHARVWQLLEHNSQHARFALRSPDGDQGYPGTLDAEAIFDLIPGGAQVTYTATTAAPTVVNLTTHPYFNLDGEGSGTIDDHHLQLPSSSWVVTTADGIATGELRSVEGTAADFRASRRLEAARQEALAQGITRGDGFDHCFVIDGSGLREHCRLVGASGLGLRIVSDQPGLQVYGGAHFTGGPGVSGRPYPPRAGVALETQHFPDSPNQPGFPAVVLRPGQEYRTLTQWLVDPV